MADDATDRDGCEILVIPDIMKEFQMSYVLIGTTGQSSEQPEGASVSEMQ